MINENDELMIGSDSLGNVLVVDDNSKNLQIISMTLNKIGYKVAVANSGLNALKYLEQKHPDIILLDIMMPEMDGFELCKILKNDPDKAYIPIIFLTAKTDIDDIINGFKIGAVDYLSKPFHTDELKVRVTNQIQLKKSKDIIKLNYIELEKLNKTLLESQNRVIKSSQELLDLNENLQKSENELKEICETKNRFFSIIAQDLKSPFSELLELTESISNNIDSLTPNDIKKLADTLVDSSKNTYNLLDQLMQWTMTQTGDMPFNPEEIDLHEICKSAISKYINLAQTKKISLENRIQESSMAYADKNMLNALIRNLIANAIKFSESGGRIIISCEQQLDKTVISVMDTGIGMSQEKADKIFSLQSKKSQLRIDKESGVGLGLPLCKEFINIHKGNIKAISTEGIGTTIYFELPIN